MSALPWPEPPVFKEPLQFGNREQIIAVRTYEKALEEQKKPDCETCGGQGYIEVDCEDCEGTGKIQTDLEEPTQGGQHG